MFKYLFSTFKLLFIITLILVSCSKKNSDFNDSETENITENPSEITKPNILLVIADDMGLDASPGYEIGSIKPYMPNLEKLAANGITFNNVWSNPTCTPTRSSILTGKYGVRTNMLKVGDVLSTSETSIQKYLANNLGSTYSHAVIGKWHLSTDPNHPTNMGVGYYAGLLTGAVSSYWDWNLTENSQTTTSTEYATTKITDLAIDWVENKTNPWFLWVAYSAPHTPFHLPPTNLHSQGNLPSDEASIVTNPLPYYMAMLEAMDSEMGRLMNSLSQEEKENTVIIFIGDNGTPQQVAQEYNSSRTKGSLYQ
ncbi:MAG: sulfatase-like hydrolase/transferase, partial [Lutibacter sp.]|uniref:sulfatase-like hydrolase/transferase n=1 Tax=Lutibacter sp. TaxID=1925666 RepID=UPI0017960FBF